jgi:predicted DNA-binding transcriptional regulator AlpA
MVKRGKNAQFRTVSAPSLDQLQDEQNVDERMVALVTGMSLGWIRKQRLLKQGPPWRKLGKSVRYPVRALREWLRAREPVAANQ